jgi:hypothetical protein
MGWSAGTGLVAGVVAPIVYLPAGPLIAASPIAGLLTAGYGVSRVIG